MDRIELNRILNELVERLRTTLNLRAINAVGIVMHSEVTKNLETGLISDTSIDSLYHQLISELNSIPR